MQWFRFYVFSTLHVYIGQIFQLWSLSLPPLSSFSFSLTQFLFKILSSFGTWRKVFHKLQGIASTHMNKADTVLTRITATMKYLFLEHRAQWKYVTIIYPHTKLKGRKDKCLTVYPLQAIENNTPQKKIWN